jgi:hypothetical protein
MKRAQESIPWTDLRADYVTHWAKSLAAFAATHDVPYGALKRRAKRENWKHLRELLFARARERSQERELAWLRKKALSAARVVERCCGPEVAQMDLTDVVRLMNEAATTLSRTMTSAAWLDEARQVLADMEAGRPPTQGKLSTWRTGRTLSPDTDPSPRSHRTVAYDDEPTRRHAA